MVVVVHLVVVLVVVIHLVVVLVVIIIYCWLSVAFWLQHLRCCARLSMGSCCQRRAAAGLPEQAGSASSLVGTAQPSVKPPRPSTTSLTELELEEEIEEPSSSEGAKLHAQNELRRRDELRRGDTS